MLNSLELFSQVEFTQSKMALNRLRLFFSTFGSFVDEICKSVIYVHWKQMRDVFHLLVCSSIETKSIVFYLYKSVCHYVAYWPHECILSNVEKGQKQKLDWLRWVRSGDLSTFALCQCGLRAFVLSPKIITQIGNWESNIFSHFFFLTTKRKCARGKQNEREKNELSFERRISEIFLFSMWFVLFCIFPWRMTRRAFILQMSSYFFFFFCHSKMRFLHSFSLFRLWFASSIFILWSRRDNN